MRKFFWAIAALLAIFIAILLHNLNTEEPPPPPPPSIPLSATPSPFSVPLDSILRIRCADPNDSKSAFLGTAEVIDQNTLFTASHVVHNSSQCVIDDGTGDPVQITYERPDMDYAVLKATTGNLYRIPINCDGFIPGHVYMLVGYANGYDFVVQTAVASAELSDLSDADGRPFTHVRTLRGLSNRSTAIPGMSGGPILDLDGNMVGTTLATDNRPNSPFAFAREMKDTSVCQRPNIPSKSRK